ncbi:aldo/keto reductase [Mesobacterium sp. TK19101]|uniref:Aldo/keto reductase n=1 Tax=Mesobacterium hydrothermale TaxID=3111907 RepID=A0ABU6HJ31_9RHOB|nr:aldo/keto reductase [Mesobacterium sp. TK19101]MEC3861864.1 aldo/keto reductase [Mesobacterium sp. TK19101]
MKQLTLSDGTPVTPFAFGTMQFGGTADAAASQALYDACRAAGITHFDSAYAYTEGRSETLLGDCARAERDKVYIATKVNYAGGGSAANIRASFDESRKRLGLDTVDLLYMHRWTDDVPLDETFGALAELQQQGLIRHIGVSNYAAWQVMKAQAVAAKLGTRIDVIQPMYNLVKRQAEVELLPMCAAEGIVAATYSPLGGGLLTGKYADGADGRLKDSAMYAARYAPAAMHDAAAELSAIAAELGTHPATLAVAWVARHPAGPNPILSARSVEQLQPSLAGMTLAMDDGLYARLSALTPTPPPATDRLEEA